jgi:CheY-like chemotaxis protein
MAHKCLLYIEDYPVVQQVYVDVLKESGFDVIIAPDGKEALTKASKQHFDIILVDLLLPNMNGLEFLEKFKKLPHSQHKKTELIILTDFDEPHFVHKAQELGITHYWMKVNNTPHELVDKIKQVVSQS